MRHVALAALFATTAAAGVAYAQNITGMPQSGMSPYGDVPYGDMTREVAKAKAMELFTRLDANDDGKLDQADRAAHVASQFDAIDTDHNGQISRAEFMAMHDHRPDGPPPGGPDDGPPGDDMGGRDHGPGMSPGGAHGPPHGPGHGSGGPGDMMAMARMADTNHDGAISQPEFMAAAMQRFDMTDSNHDGKLSPAERQAERGRMHDMPGGAPPPPPPGPPPPPPAN